MQGSDEERKLFFENARKQAETDWKRNKKDCTALTRWGGALLELANFMPGEEASGMVDEAVVKFKQALEIDPQKHDALWCLGNAYTSQGFLSPQKSNAVKLFQEAKECFHKALEVQPESAIYKKGVEMAGKAPELYDEIQKQLAQSSGPPPPPPSAKTDTFWFDVLGYCSVFAFVFGVSFLVSMANPQTGGPAGASK